MSKAWDPDDILDVLASDDVRRILAATSVHPMSAKELAEVCDRPLATVYRRIQAMQDYDLLSEELTRDPDGTQYNEYRCGLNEISIEVADGQLNVNIDINKDTVDQFAELVEAPEKPGGQADVGERDS